MADTYILGIESSCDETAAAVVCSGETIASNVVFSQIATHQPYGGVVPELASRDHVQRLLPLVRGQLILWVRRPMARSSRRRWIGPTRARRGSIRGRARLAALILTIGTFHRSQNG